MTCSSCNPGPGAVVAVAMSGGVDSTVTAALMKEVGYRVRGVFMSLAQPDREVQAARARAMAERLGIPFEVIDLSDEFDRLVLSYFRDGYSRGITPNPCVVCNRTIKFGLLLDRVLAGGADYLATGHYVRKVLAPSGGFRLSPGCDPNKDQSYFLCLLNQDQLARVIFPLGEKVKAEVYDLAAGLGLRYARSEESQDVCFLKGQDLATYLGGVGLSGQPGGIVTLVGREVGRHQGISHFTIGQRRGLGIPDVTPWYVVAIDPGTNQVVVGKDNDLFRAGLIIKPMSWAGGELPDLGASFTVKIRYRHRAVPAQLKLGHHQEIIIQFSEPQRAITPGQFAAVYQGDLLLGGGPIQLVPAGSSTS
ncbi:MAG: tRNA 2-thiouridine(34) synthase MnmA [Proteobacteria bacterium]|nr:tRNA 2-thiouridine(34) synthase MnmA [Pseudomonadota bacterium]MBU1686264.1 tRNA 2-thiouridine(34) synthase MnmA [Pseudomonadota bacterium]